MKVESTRFKIVLIGLVTIALCFASGGMGLAMVSQTGTDAYCNQCHTNGNLTDGSTTQTCVQCHSSSTSYTTYNLTGGGQTVTVPVVNYTGASAPNEYLAGGNFWWVADLYGNDDAKGHNVLDIAGSDPNYVGGAPGSTVGCSSSCHDSLATTGYGSPGCNGCHMYPAHHADDSNTVVGSESPDTDGYYRFLAGHNSGNTHGVCGIEDSDWEAISSATVHNEYLGFAGDHGFAAGFYDLGHTMTAFCCGCHGNYHIQNPPSARHPSDFVIPNSGPYANAFGAGGSGTGIYEPNIPVARPSLNGTVSPTVTLDTDMVMCLSCHRAHGSPYRKMLRWDIAYTTNPCSKCHTNLEKP
jgi:predicted CXXCH cytochrome family protein